MSNYKITESFIENLKVQGQKEGKNQRRYQKK